MGLSFTTGSSPERVASRITDTLNDVYCAAPSKSKLNGTIEDTGEGSDAGADSWMYFFFRRGI